MLEEILRRVPFFSTLPPRHLRWLAETLRAEDILAGTVLFHEGDPGEVFYVILQGEIEIYTRLADGGRELISVRGPGEYIGEMSLLHPLGLRSASARALGDAEVLVMTRAQFDALLQRQPTLGYHLARVLGDRLDQANAAALRRLEDRNRALQAAFDELRAAQAELVEKQKLEHELALAREIQMSLLPAALPEMAVFDFGARLAPMSQVGGDFYDVIQLDDGNLGIVVGEVLGHGMPAALIMAITVALLRAQACRGCPPSEVLTAVNRELLKLGANRTFVTVLYGVLRTSTGEFAYACAGHEPPILAVPGREPVYASQPGGRLLGLFEEVALTDGSLNLPPGGSLLLYTDGVIKGRNPGRDFFGEQRLADLVLQTRDLSAQGVCDRVVAAVGSHVGGSLQQDDITVFCAQRMSTGAAAAQAGEGK